MTIEFPEKVVGDRAPVCGLNSSWRSEAWTTLKARSGVQEENGTLTYFVSVPLSSCTLERNRRASVSLSQVLIQFYRAAWQAL